MPQLLIIEDEVIIRKALKRLLERNHYDVLEAGTVDEAVQLLQQHSVQLIITDLRLPGAPGTDIIAHANHIPVLVMTSYASLRSAVDTMRQGAIDYIAKPFDHDEMLSTIAQILSKSVNQQPASEKRTPSITPSAPSDQSLNPSELQTKLSIIGSSPAMQTLYQQIVKVAPTQANVLIHGESGTGKELVAQALHHQSNRAQGPLISVNCAAIPESLIESELFGHEKGAFTGANSSRTGLIEAASGGTLFLDEIGELPLEAQARLLRFIQEGEIRRVGSVQSKKVDVRLVAATHRDLKTRAQSGEFREDLYYRLHVIAFNIPPLRERGNDVVEIAQALLSQQAAKQNKPHLHFTEQTLALLPQYSWPGNVRELENAIERAVVLSDENSITPQLMGIDWPVESNLANTQSEAETPPSSLENYFQNFVLEHQDQMTETELAKQLGISRKCLWERRQRLGIPRYKN